MLVLQGELVGNGVLIMGRLDLCLCLTTEELDLLRVYFFLTGVCLFSLCSEGQMYLQMCRLFLQTSWLYFGAWCLWVWSCCGIGCLGGWRLHCTSMNRNRVGETPGFLSPLRETRVGLEAELESHQPRWCIISGIHAPLLKALGTLQAYLGQLLLQMSYMSFEHLLFCSLDFDPGKHGNFCSGV